MMNPYVRRLSKRLHPLGDLIMSAVGGFVLVVGSGLLATGKEGSDTAASTRACFPRSQNRDLGHPQKQRPGSVYPADIGFNE
jgi:hypothetical protein